MLRSSPLQRARLNSNRGYPDPSNASQFLLDPRMPDRRRIRQVQVGAASRTDLHVQLQRLVAGRALPFRFVLLDPVEDRGDEAEEGDDGADREPDPEGAALALGDEAGGEAEEEGDHEVLHAVILTIPGHGS